MKKKQKAEKKQAKEDKKKAKEEAKEDKKKTAAPISHLDPDKDTTDVTPFRDNPSRLAMLVDPKSLEDLEKLGGIQGVLDGLGVDSTKGLSTGKSDGGAPRSGGDMPAGNGAQWRATIEDRRRIYGANDLPDRPTKSLFRLMWEAFQDKVLVSTAAQEAVS